MVLTITIMKPNTMSGQGHRVWCSLPEFMKVIVVFLIDGWHTSKSLCDWAFNHLIRIFKNLGYDVFPTDDPNYVGQYRLEGQKRGNIHVHGLCKLKSDPGLHYT
jgi:hypothetical protein